MEVTVLNRQRRHRVRAAGIGGFLERVAAAVEPSEAPEDLEEATVGVTLVSTRCIRELNRRYRGKDRATDVLAFPAGPSAVPVEPPHLGDIVIGVSEAAEQARNAGHSLNRELRLLALHGYLHLVGYDHERDDGEMARLERRLRRRLLPRRTRRPR